MLARTASADGADIENLYGLKFGHFVIVVTAIAASPSVVFTVQGKDPAGNYYSILVSPEITGIGTTVLRVGPGLSASANAVANDIVPPVFRVIATAADADSMTYSVSVAVS